MRARRNARGRRKRSSIQEERMVPSLPGKQFALYLALCLALPAGRSFAQPAPQTAADGAAQSSGSATSDAARPPQDRASQNQSENQTAGQAGTAAQTSSVPPAAPLAHPVGTAVAPYEASGGVTGSRPAGAVIAPAKQRRFHAFFIRVAVVIGAAAATGAVIALSRASPSQPH